MIHLDRDRNELSSDHLILSEDHSAFSWVDIPPDDNYLTSLSHLNSPEHVQPSSDSHGDSTQGQIHNPSSPPNAADDKSSSLSPPPEYPAPQIQPKNSPLPPQQEISVTDQPEGNTEDDGDGDGDGDGSYSRQLTPLTDLSAVADGDESLDFEKKDSAGENESHTGIPDKIGDTKGATDKAENRWVEKHGSISPSSPTRHLVPIPGPHQPLPIAGPSQTNQRLAPFAGPSHSRRPSSRDMISASQLPSPNISAAKLSGGDAKVVRILEINSELLKVCMEFQTRGVPTNDPRFGQFANRLQVNLTWLASAADQQRCSDPRLALPTMDAPPPVEFVSMDRIQQLYADLPTIFAKEIARRQVTFGTQYSPTAPSALVNGSLKRSRPDDVTDPMNKRRDVGETKSHSMQPPAIPSISISGSGQRVSPTSSFPAPAHSNLSVAGAPQSPRDPSPSISMPPPLSTPSLPFGANEASIAATTRARAREMQIHQAREQQLRTAQMQQQQQQQMQGARQISPPTTSPQIPQSSGPGATQHPHAPFGPNASAMQILQDPSHPFMAYLMSQIPNFTSLPLQQQLLKLTNFQNILLAQKQQQNPSNQQRPPMPGQMPNLGQNPSMSPMPNVPMTSGGPSPVSPLGQQSPLSSQTQQMNAQPPQSGMYPFSNQSHGAPGVDPRMASSNFTPQMPGNMNAMNMNQQQQRQMMLMQQQMRNTGVNMNAPNLMNQQQAYAMQQRMPQGGPSQVGGSPMSAPTSDTFPALRSNSTIPGIARSGRSPSESAHSPMTPRAPSRLSSQPPMQPEDYQRAMSQQQAQQGMMGTPQNSNSFHPQM
ncbi:hypothetical protein AZE42_00756, partial [Rhizopogon vesiculosus]